MRLRRRDAGGTSCRRGHAIGLDLGATEARVVVLTLGREDPREVLVESTTHVDLPPGTVVNGVVTDPGALTTALTVLWRRADLGCRHVVLGIAGTQVQVRKLQVPDIDPARQAEALPFQAREVVALPLDAVVLDFSPLGPAPEAPHLVDGLLVASPREPVEVAVAAVEAAGLRVDRVDLSPFAVLRAVATPGLASEAVVDLGAHLTTVVVHHDGVPAMVRTLARGGQEITTRLAERLSTDEAEAEELKRRHGLDGDPEVSAVLRDVVVPLLTDLRTSLNYFRSTNGGVRIEKVTLTGRAAQLPGLADAVSAQVGVETTVDASASSGGDALGTGLAIGAAA